MSFKNTFIHHDRSPEVTAWIEEERVEQEERFATIVQEMGAIEPKREKWYQEFFDRLTTHGFNQDGDMKVKIAPQDLPVKTEGREDRGFLGHSSSMRSSFASICVPAET